METKLFLADHVEAVHDYEKGKLPADLKPIQIEMKSWEHPWRIESLNHYSGIGWSFVAFEGDKIVGYILAQPFLFMNNWTQSLWVEYVSSDSPEIRNQLVDVVIRWSKTKHLQKVIMNNRIKELDSIRESFGGFKEGGYIHLSTTKLSEDEA